MQLLHLQEYVNDFAEALEGIKLDDCDAKARSLSSWMISIGLKLAPACAKSQSQCCVNSGALFEMYPALIIISPGLMFKLWCGMLIPVFTNF